MYWISKHLMRPLKSFPTTGETPFSPARSRFLLCSPHHDDVRPLLPAHPRLVDEADLRAACRQYRHRPRDLGPLLQLWTIQITGLLTLPHAKLGRGT